MKAKIGSSSRIPELDGLRVLMILIVSWYHFWQQSWLTPQIPFHDISVFVRDRMHLSFCPVMANYSLDYLVRSGYVWVDGTVLLSAFLLFMPYARSMLEGAPLPDTRDFYFRRARRVLPSYYFIILLLFFGMALPYKLYSTPQYMVKDLATHLTFTFPFFRDTLLWTPVGGAAWTLAIEVQAYLLFPLIARAIVRKPAATLCVLLTLGLGFRVWCIWSLDAYETVVNQLINFLDVYVTGILGSMIYVRLSARRKKWASFRWSKFLMMLCATLLFLAAFWGLLSMLRVQASSSYRTASRGFAGWVSDTLGNRLPYDRNTWDTFVLQRNQMIHRPVFAFLFLFLILSAPFSFPPLRFLLGNPLMRFLSSVSMNYYLIHQTLAVHLRRLRIPWSEYEYPNMAGQPAWQIQYTSLCFGISFLLAVLITFGVEKPVGRLLTVLRYRRTARGNPPAGDARPGPSR